MTLDGSISSPAAGVGLIVVFLVGANLLERRWNPQPPRDRYLRRPDEPSFVAFWNLFSTQKWTDEGIRFHKRRMLFIPITLLALGFMWALADLIW